MNTTRENGCYSVRRLQPEPNAGRNSLPRWAIEYDIYPDTTGMVGTGIISHSRSTFAYLTAPESDAQLIEQVFNLNQKYDLSKLEASLIDLMYHRRFATCDELSNAVDVFITDITRENQTT